jgi:hypothetical protein
LVSLVVTESKKEERKKEIDVVRVDRRHSPSAEGDDFDQFWFSNARHLFFFNLNR